MTRLFSCLTFVGVLVSVAIAQDDVTVWPNKTSSANSDPWIAEHHDSIQQMRPRVLVINFSNEQSMTQVEKLVDSIIKGVAEGSRWHGYADPNAPVFLQYEVFKFVDLRDANNSIGDSSREPAKPVKEGEKDLQFQYAALYSDEFAKLYGVADEANPGKFLNLRQLVDRGMVHEVWCVISGNTKSPRQVGMWESIELKLAYDDNFKAKGDDHVHAGNGEDPDQPWIGRSLRIGCINASRGPGCFLESLSHSFEHMAQGGAIPYLVPYFKEFGDFDLDKRYGTPFDSLYGPELNKRDIEYPNPTTALIPHKGEVIRIDNYSVHAGNAHNPPNARRQYDQDNTVPVMSTIEDWRQHSGPDGKDIAKPWTSAALDPYRTEYRDCMGAWLVYWRQNFPGLNNKAKDDAGRPMKNWWPFLFY